MKNCIKELRKARGLRQEDMAHLLGVSRQTVVAMENNKYDPTLELAMKVARLLEQPVERIFFLDARISGVSPADITALMIYMETRWKGEKA